MKFKFENLEIWKKAMELGEVIDKKAFDFPKRELYSLSSQLRRATDSVGLNIAEGSIGQSNPEQKKFISYAIRSLAEVVTCLYKAKNRAYLTEQEFESLYADSFTLMNMMVSFKRNIH